MLLAFSFLSLSIVLVTIALVIVCLLMILLVLMQRPKQEGLGAAFGAGITDQIWGNQTTTILQKGTVNMGVLLFVLSLTLAMLKAAEHNGGKLSRDLTEAAAPAAPAPEPTPEPQPTPASTVTPPVQIPPAPVTNPTPTPSPAPAPTTPTPENSTPSTPPANPPTPPAESTTPTPSPAPPPAPSPAPSETAAPPKPAETPAPAPAPAPRSKDAFISPVPRGPNHEAAERSAAFSFPSTTQSTRLFPVSGLEAGKLKTCPGHGSHTHSADGRHLDALVLFTRKCEAKQPTELANSPLSGGDITNLLRGFASQAFCPSHDGSNDESPDN